MFPTELCEWAQWIAWKNVEKDGKLTKLPYSPRTGNLASVADPNSWTDFKTACHAIKYSNYYDGIGFVLTDNDPYTFIDLDCPNGDETIALKQLKVANTMNSYSEVSPSGKGLHIIVKARIPGGRRKGKIEIYSSLRYMTMTGRTFHDLPIEDRQELAEQLWKDLDDNKGGNSPLSVVKDEPQRFADDYIYTVAASAKNGEKFEALWRGDWQHIYTSHSEADYSLINIISYYSHNIEQIRRMFMMSALGKREKAKRRYYQDNMIRKSFDNQPPLIPLEEMIANTELQLKEIQLNPFAGPLFENTPDEDFDWTVPPGLLGDVAQFIYRAAPRPSKEIALGAAIGLMSGICGRSYNVSGTGLNQYVLILAKTGTGKEGAASGIDKLMQRVKLTTPSALEFLGPSEIASGQALIKFLAKRPCFVSIVGEFGLALQQMCSPIASPSQVQLRKMLLALYGKSGAAQIQHGMIYSDKESNVGDIKAPAFSILGESTPETFYPNLDDYGIAQGLFPRFLCIEYDGDRPSLNEGHQFVEPTRELIEKVGQLCANALVMAHHDRVIAIKLDEEAEALSRQLDKRCDGKVNTSEMEVARQLWNRAHLKTLKLASLIAIGLNIYEPVITAESMKWATMLVERDVTNILKQFDSGKAGREFGETAQLNETVAIIGDYLRRTYLGLDRYRVKPQMHADKVVPFDYLHRRLCQRGSFRNDRMGATNALKRTLDSLVSDGSLRLLRELEVYKRYGLTAKSYAVADVTRYIGE